LTERDFKEKIRSAIDGNTAALEELYAAKRRELYFAALTMLGSKEDAEDAVQDTMIGVFRNIGNLKSPNAFNIWIHKMLRGHCVDIIRKKERQVFTVLLQDETVDMLGSDMSESEPEKMLERREMSAEIYEAIRSLPEKSREAIILYYFSDMKYKEIAAVTGSSIKTVSTNLIRAKKNLKSFLGEHYPEAAPLAALLPALKATALAKTVGGGAALAGAKLNSGVLFGNHILAVASNVAAPAAIVVAGSACAAAVTYSVLTTPTYAITLAGDCDCGHINPHTIELTGMRAGEALDKWEVLAQDGGALHTGDLASVTEYVRGLEEARRYGHYTLRCAVTSNNGGSYFVSRTITIGDLAGDA
jgi:RNA polymerase sigma-70 factor (ECF subfamily)